MDLRRRIVDAYDNGEGSYKEIGERFRVGEASVSRFMRLHRYGGDLRPGKSGGDRRSKNIPDEVAKTIEVLILDEPNWTTQELADQVQDEFGFSLTRYQVGKFLRSNGFSFKRGSTDRGLQRNPVLSNGEMPILPNSGRWIPLDSFSSTKLASSWE